MYDGIDVIFNEVKPKTYHRRERFSNRMKATFQIRQNLGPVVKRTRVHITEQI